MFRFELPGNTPPSPFAKSHLTDKSNLIKNNTGTSQAGYDRETGRVFLSVKIYAISISLRSDLTKSVAEQGVVGGKIS